MKDKKFEIFRDWDEYWKRKRAREEKKVGNQQAMQKMESYPFYISILILMHLRFHMTLLLMRNLAIPITISYMISPNCTCEIIEVQKCPTVCFSVGYQITEAMKSS